MPMSMQQWFPNLRNGDEFHFLPIFEQGTKYESVAQLKKNPGSTSLTEIMKLAAFDALKIWIEYLGSEAYAYGPMRSSPRTGSQQKPPSLASSQVAALVVVEPGALRQGPSAWGPWAAFGLGWGGR